MTTKLLNNFISALTGGVSTAVINLATIPVLFKSYGIEGYGELAIILTTYLVIQIVTSLQLWQAFIKYWYDNRFEKNKSITFSFLLDFFSCAFGSLVLFFVFTSHIYEKYLFHIDYQVAIFFSLALLFNPFSFFIGICRVREKFLFISFCECVRSLVRLVGAIVSLSYGTFLVYALFYLLSNVVVLLISTLVMKRDLYKAFSSIKHIDKTDFDNFFIFTKFSFLVSMKSIIDLPVQHLDKILVSSILGNSSVAVYDIAKRINQGFAVLINVINQIFYPYIVKEISVNGFVEMFSNICKWTLILFSSFSVFITIFLFNFNYYVYDLYYAIFELSFESFEFNMYYTLVFLVSSCFLLFHVIFQAAGFVSKDVKILIFANSIYFLTCFFGLKFFGIDVLIFAYLIQILIVLGFKLIILQNYQINEKQREELYE